MIMIPSNVGRRTALLAALLACGLGCNRKPGAPAGGMPPPNVEVAAVVQQDAPVYLDAIGRCVAPQVVSIRPQVAGRLTGVHFADGADVKKGDELFTVDRRPFEIQLASAEANHSEANAAHELAKLDFARAATLIEGRAISQQDYDRSQNAVEVAAARIAQTKAAVDAAKLNLEYCSIRSPIDGRAGHRLRDVGNIVTANETELLLIEQLDPLYADFTVPERTLASLRRYMGEEALAVEVRVPDEGGEPLAGRLTFLDNRVDDQTGTVRLRATVPNPDRRLWPGRFVQARVILAMLKGALLVPAAAPQVSAQGQFVYVVTEAGIAELRPVKLGQRHGGLILVEEGGKPGEGVKPGERVIVNGHMGVQKDKPVRVVEKP